MIDLREISEAVGLVGVIHYGFQSESLAMILISLECGELDSRINDIRYVFFDVSVSLDAFVSTLEFGKFAVSCDESRYGGESAELYFARIGGYPSGIEPVMEFLMLGARHGDYHFAVLLVDEIDVLHRTYLIDGLRNAVTYADGHFYSDLVARAGKRGSVGRCGRLVPISEFYVRGIAGVGNLGVAQIPFHLIEYVTSEEIIAYFAVHGEGLSVVLHHSRVHEGSR